MTPAPQFAGSWFMAFAEHGFPLFASLVRSVEIAMAKADFAIARLYADLVTDTSLRDRVFEMLRQEFERSNFRLITDIDARLGEINFLLLPRASWEVC